MACRPAALTGAVRLCRWSLWAGGREGRGARQKLPLSSAKCPPRTRARAKPWSGLRQARACTGKLSPVRRTEKVPSRTRCAETSYGTVAGGTRRFRVPRSSACSVLSPISFACCLLHRSPLRAPTRACGPGGNGTIRSSLQDRSRLDETASASARPNLPDPRPDISRRRRAATYRQRPLSTTHFLRARRVIGERVCNRRTLTRTGHARTRSSPVMSSHVLRTLDTWQ